MAGKGAAEVDPQGSHGGYRGNADGFGNGARPLERIVAPETDMGVG